MDSLAMKAIAVSSIGVCRTGKETSISSSSGAAMEPFGMRRFWDVTMLGRWKAAVEHLYQTITLRPAPRLTRIQHRLATVNNLALRPAHRPAHPPVHLAVRQQHHPLRQTRRVASLRHRRVPAIIPTRAATILTANRATIKMDPAVATKDFQTIKTKAPAVALQTTKTKDLAAAPQTMTTKEQTAVPQTIRTKVPIVTPQTTKTKPQAAVPRTIKTKVPTTRVHRISSNHRIIIRDPIRLAIKVQITIKRRAQPTMVHPIIQTVRMQAHQTAALQIIKVQPAMVHHKDLTITKDPRTMKVPARLAQINLTQTTRKGQTPTVEHQTLLRDLQTIKNHLTITRDQPQRIITMQAQTTTRDLPTIKDHLIIKAPPPATTIIIKAHRALRLQAPMQTTTIKVQTATTKEHLVTIP